MPVPDFQTLMLPVLETAAAGPTSAGACLPEVAKRFSLTDDDLQELLPSGRQPTIMNRLHWAKIYLERAGLVRSIRRGVFEITPEGERLLEERPGRVDMKLLERFESYRQWRHESAKKAAATRGQVNETPATELTPVAQTPDEAMEQAYNQLEAALVDDVLARVLEVTPTQFEELIVDLLQKMGYGGGLIGAGRAIGGPGDGGVDGIINEDPLGLDRVYIQAKRYALDSNVGRPAIQQFVGSLTGESATKGVFVTTSDFSADARAYVERVQQRIVLIDGKQLAQLMIAHEVGVRSRTTYVLRSVDEDYFSDA